MRRSLLCLAAPVLASVVLGGPALSQPASGPVRPDSVQQPVFSMGQPMPVRPYVAGAGVWDRGADALGGELTVGVFKPFINPIVGVGLAVEGTVGYADGVTSGARALGSLRSVGLQVGAEVRFDERRTDLIVSLLPPVRRGGPFGQGGSLRLDWLPTRDHTLRLGLSVPVGSRWSGEGRPRRSTVPLPRAPRGARTLASEAFPPSVETALRLAARNAFWITAYSNAFRDNSGGNENEALAEFRTDLRAWRDSLGDAESGFPTFVGADAAYHDAVVQAFAAAVGPDHAAVVAAAARTALLDEVLLPYDRLLGQFKSHDSLLGFAPAAHDRFGTFLADTPGLDAEAQARAQNVLSGLVDIAEANRAWILNHWRGDSRLVWLPLQFALRPDEHDEQSELDALVARAVDRPFTSGNWVLPVNNTWFYRDLITSIHAARDYHVLWVHDIAGHDPIGRPDTVTSVVATVGYIDALTEAVERYGETRRIPSYVIFLDEKSFSATGAQDWLHLLEDPIGTRLSLPGNAAMRRTVREAQERLRAAVAASEPLQADAATQGRGWLRGIVKVNVNITFPSDYSFNSAKLVSWWPGMLPILPDELMRDHRKVAFYDLTERDPRRGMALLAGTGVGEQYASPTWEDRGVLTGGPSALGLKDAARALLLGQGVRPEEIPEPLRAQPFPDDYGALVAELDAQGADADALNVHNGVGFAPKQATVAQSVIYTLMPAGCVAYIPDSLWLSSFWAGQLTGAAFRGCDVRIIAPSLANAPSAGGSVMSRSRAIVSRLLAVQTEMQDVFAAGGGDLRVGIYTRESSVNDLPAVIREARAGYAATPFLHTEVPLPDSVWQAIATAPDRLDAGGFEAAGGIADVVDRLPKLHRKTQFIALKPVMQEIAREMDVATVRDGLIASASSTAQPGSVDLEARVAAAYPMVLRVALLPDSLRESAVFYSLIGSMNKDDRSLMLDGETLHITSGPWTMAQYPDFVLLLGRTTWVTEQSQIDALIPPYNGLTRRLGRLLRAVL